MKKRVMAGVLLLGVLLSGCGADKDAGVDRDEACVQTVATDFYTLALPSQWQVQPVAYDDGLPSGDVHFFDAAGEQIGGAVVLMAVNDSLTDVPQQIRVIAESLEEGVISGKIEVVGDALGGDTSSEYHALVPLEEERGVHEYVDIYLQGADYDLAQVLSVADSVVIRNQAFVGYIAGLEDARLMVQPVELVEENDVARVAELALSESDFARGLAVVKRGGEAKSFPLAQEAQYYLFNSEEQRFTAVTREDFQGYCAQKKDGLFDVTITDGQVVLVEERVL